MEKQGLLSSNKAIAGWSIVELTIVISIIAILAVIALPKYLNLATNSRIASIQAAAGAMHSASIIVFSTCTLDPTCNINSGPGSGNGLNNSIVIQGQSITLAFGYPRATPAGIIRASNLDLGPYEVLTGVTGSIRVRAPGARLVANCQVQYDQPANAGGFYTLTMSISGC